LSIFGGRLSYSSKIKNKDSSAIGLGMTRWVFVLIGDELNFSGFPPDACGNDGIKKHAGMTERRSNGDGAGKIERR